MSKSELARDVAPELSKSPTLSTWDVVSLVIGIVVGVSIFKVPGDVFRYTGSPAMGLAVWALGAVLALSGALCYAELAATYPQFGAGYVFLGRAFGRPLGFLFAWMQTCIILPGSVGAMAFVFAAYAGSIWPWMSAHSGLTGAGAIAALTVLQLFGFQVGRLAQNVLTTIKIISLASVLVCGLILSPQNPHAMQPAVETTPATWDGIGLALVFVLYAYGGWSDVASVTPEVRDCRKNMPRGLMIGLGIVAGLYLLLNLSFLKGLGYADVRQVEAPVAEVIRRALGSTFSNAMSLIVMASALGAIHGMMFSGCRLLTAVGQDYPLFQKWSEWNSRHVAVWALMTVSGMSLLLTAIVGTEAGRNGVIFVTSALKLPDPNWEKYGGGFDLLVSASSPIFWAFFFLTAVSLFVLRIRDPQRPRPFRVPAYPLTPIVFAGTALYMLWSSSTWAGQLTLLFFPVFVIGVVLALAQQSGSRRSQNS
ncbi:APC family permease [Planctomicrobium sp. SH661]|uniref:APC family permease n=1 Tax=Planctomicrobium sp. SH661 TaxID=3448124 RepID=UPI003F5BC58A